jgi:hypothetical protein
MLYHMSDITLHRDVTLGLSYLAENSLIPADKLGESIATMLVRAGEQDERFRFYAIGGWYSDTYSHTLMGVPVSMYITLTVYLQVWLTAPRTIPSPVTRWTRW